MFARQVAGIPWGRHAGEQTLGVAHGLTSRFIVGVVVALVGSVKAAAAIVDILAEMYVCVCGGEQARERVVSRQGGSGGA